MSDRLRGLKIALVALSSEYGRPARGMSYECANFYGSFQQMFQEVRFFDYYPLFQTRGKRAMNEALLEWVRAETPDLTIFPLFQDEFDPAVIRALKDFTQTLAYFFDDIWRIDFALSWAPHFSWIVTPSSTCLRRYRELGLTHVLYSPLGYNHWLFQKRDLPKRHDVSFVGGFHPYRSWVIRRLRKAGIEVATWGGGPWPAGRLTYEAMVDVLNQTKINLNISNAVSWHLPYLLSTPKALRVAMSSGKVRESLKARLFEVAGCGGFQLTHYLEDLERCFDIGREIVLYADLDDLIDKIRYYLRHDDERQALAEAGHRRARAEHTYARRFSEIVTRIFEPPDGP